MIAGIARIACSMPFPGPSSPKVSRHGFSLDAELPLEAGGFRERHVGDAVRDDVDHRLGHLVDLAQDFPAHACHDHEAVAVIGEALHHVALRRVRILEDGVERGHHRQARLADQCEHVTAGRSAEDAEFVLDAQHVHLALVESVRGEPIGSRSFCWISISTRGG